MHRNLRREDNLSEDLTDIFVHRRRRRRPSPTTRITDVDDIDPLILEEPTTDVVELHQMTDSLQPETDDEDLIHSSVENWASEYILKSDISSRRLNPFRFLGSMDYVMKSQDSDSVKSEIVQILYRQLFGLVVWYHLGHSTAQLLPTNFLFRLFTHFPFTLIPSILADSNPLSHSSLSCAICHHLGPPLNDSPMNPLLLSLLPSAVTSDDQSASENLTLDEGKSVFEIFRNISVKGKRKKQIKEPERINDFLVSLPYSQNSADHPNIELWITSKRTLSPTEFPIPEPQSVVGPFSTGDPSSSHFWMHEECLISSFCDADSDDGLMLPRAEYFAKVNIVSYSKM